MKLETWKACTFANGNKNCPITSYLIKIPKRKKKKHVSIKFSSRYTFSTATLDFEFTSQEEILVAKFIRNPPKTRVWQLIKKKKRKKSANNLVATWWKFRSTSLEPGRGGRNPPGRGANFTWRHRKTGVGWRRLSMTGEGRRWWIDGTRRRKGDTCAGIVGLPCAHTPSPFVSHCCPGRKGRQAGTLDTSRQCETAFTPGTVTCTLALRNARICVYIYIYGEREKRFFHLFILDFSIFEHFFFFSFFIVVNLLSLRLYNRII